MSFQTLIVAAHPDDEALSCGGLIQNRLQNPEGLVTVLVVHGRAYPEYDPDSIISVALARRQKENFSESLAVLAKDSKNGPIISTYLGLAEGEPYQHGHYMLLSHIEGTLALGGGFYDEVVIPSPSDLNQDHEHLSRICKIALRPANLRCVKRVLIAHAHDGGTPTGANWFELMTEDQLEVKQKAVATYVDEIRAHPHPRSPENIRAHAMQCGSVIGEALAEPYTLWLQK
jgi:LmbE family N-acetylglucosaminyl deacetylase